jgi:hypothetical protein
VDSPASIVDALRRRIERASFGEDRCPWQAAATVVNGNAGRTGAPPSPA